MRDIRSRISPKLTDAQRQAMDKVAIDNYRKLKNLETAMTEPTPRPWHCDHGDDGIDYSHEYSDIYVDGGNIIIAQVNHLIPEGDANARLIVTAVNCHDDLVAALEEIAKGEGRYSQDPYRHAHNAIEDMMKHANKALAKVREQESQG